MRFTLVLLLALAAAGVAVADHDDLHVGGEGVRTIVIVDKPPFTVTAPVADLYFWTIPSGVKADERDNTIQVYEAPPGNIAISVQVLKIDWDGKKLNKKTYSVVVRVGGDSPPKPPAPIDPLAKEFSVLFAADPAPDKAGKLAYLASVFRGAVGYANDKDVGTADQLAAMVRSAVEAKLKALSDPESGLKALRQKIGELTAAEFIALTPGSPLTPETRARCAAFYDKIASALESVK